MTLPIIAYGDPMLRKKCKEIPRNSKDLQNLIDNMFETMMDASGVGLAAPQVGESIRMFTMNSNNIVEDNYPEETGYKRAFINPKIIIENDEPVVYNEGCLSIPAIREDITRPVEITIKYLDRQFKPKAETFFGINARIIQHEFDHINGVLFTDYLTPLKKRLLKKELENISKGIVDVTYAMKFPRAKKKRV